ncbi:MAG: DMT family transporter [Candidatus Odinarchaeota archaeon]
MLIIGIIAALTAALSWAISAAFYKSGAQNVSPITANLIRVIPPLIVLATGALFLNLYAIIPFLDSWQLWLIFGSSLFAFVLGDALYFVTIQNIGVSRGVPLTAIYPLFVLVFQVLFLAQPISLLMFPAALVTVAGVAILSHQLETSPDADQTRIRRTKWIGVGAAIGTALCWSISILLLSEVLQTTNLVLVAVIRLVIAFLILTPLTVGQRYIRKQAPLSQRQTLFLSIGGLFALCFGYLAFAISLQLLDTTSAALLSSLTPLFAAVIGWRNLQEQLDIKTVIGIMACVVGIILTALAVAII